MKSIVAWRGVFPEDEGSSPETGKKMRPNREQPQRELFQIDLEQLIDTTHSLIRLGRLIDWQAFEQTLGHVSPQ